MRWVRQIAFAILFAGWMLPAFLAQAVRARAPAAPDPRTPFQVMAGVAPPPPGPAEQVASMFTAIAVLWFLIAFIYAGVLAMRLRRSLLG